MHEDKAWKENEASHIDYESLSNIIRPLLKIFNLLIKLKKKRKKMIDNKTMHIFTNINYFIKWNKLEHAIVLSLESVVAPIDICIKKN